MIKCHVCGEESVIKVAEHGDIDMFSCCNEDCPDYAELLTNISGQMLSVANTVKAYRQVVEEVTSEKDKISGS